MKKFFGPLQKMAAQPINPVSYSLSFNGVSVTLNDFFKNYMQFRFTGVIYCIQCKRRTKKSFQQGYCYPCFRRLAECGFCIIHPEKCHYEQGSCRENDWAHAHCLQNHFVYLANSSGLKVGVTRHTQVPTRWIDQGAQQALPIFQVANRYQSGLLEVCLKQFVNDRTDWRKLLKRNALHLDLEKERNRLLDQSQDELEITIKKFPAKDIQLLNSSVVELHYPVQNYPEKVNNLSLDKTPQIGGYLQGIKGQYLLFDSGVMNVRKFAGYEVEFSISE